VRSAVAWPSTKLSRRGLNLARALPPFSAGELDASKAGCGTQFQGARADLSGQPRASRNPAPALFCFAMLTSRSADELAILSVTSPRSPPGSQDAQDSSAGAAYNASLSVEAESCRAPARICPSASQVSSFGQRQAPAERETGGQAVSHHGGLRCYGPMRTARIPCTFCQRDKQWEMVFG